MNSTPDILTLREFSTRDKAGSSSRSEAYNPQTEEYPDHPWYQMNKKIVEGKLAYMSNKLDGIVKNARAEDTELIKSQALARQISDVPQKDVTTVIMVGQQGNGKSTTCNALMDRLNLSETSAFGKACTQYLTMYTYRPGTGDYDEISDYQLQFWNDATIQDFLEELIRRYRFFHFGKREDSQFMEDEKEDASSAKQIFELIFNVEREGRVKLDALLTEENIDNGNFLQQCLEEAKTRIRDAGADAKRMIRIPNVTDANLGVIRKIGFNLWPLVEGEMIATGGRILRNGVALIDSPGFGDLNQTRTAFVNAFRRSADHEFIFTKPDRASTDRDAIRQIHESIKFHGEENTTLVINKNDDVFNDDGVLKEIETSTEHPNPLIKQYKRETEDSNLDDSVIDNYIEYLHNIVRFRFLEAREKQNETLVQQSIASSVPIKTIHVSAGAYNRWIAKSRGKRPQMTANMSRIPELRSLLLRLPSDKNYQRYYDHCFETIPNIVDAVGRILEKQPVDDSYAQIRQQMKEHISVIETTLQDHFTNFLENLLPKVWPDSMAKYDQTVTLRGLVNEWSSAFHWSTFDKMVREFGILYKTRSSKVKNKHLNWNDDIQDSFAENLDEWKEAMIAQADAVCKCLSTAIEEILDNMHESIEQTSSNQKLKIRTLKAWRKTERSVNRDIGELRKQLRQAVYSGHRFATTETDTGCMIAGLTRSIFQNAARVERGPGFHGRQITAIQNGLTKTDVYGCKFLDKVEKKVLREVKKKLERVYKNFVKSILDKFEDFVQVTEEFLETSFIATKHDLRLREQLRDLYMELKTDMMELQNYFPELELPQMAHHTYHEDDNERRPFKRLRLQ